jgi:hypothetical protein
MALASLASSLRLAPLPVTCRFCRGTHGAVVLDLGEQPSSELFPAATDPGPDPLLPLRMWLCAGCGLAQLVGADDVAEEPLGTEPLALARQRSTALERLVTDGVLPTEGTVAEYPSPHGGTWQPEASSRNIGGALVQLRSDPPKAQFQQLVGTETLADLTANLESRAPAGTAEVATLPATSRGFDVVDVGPLAVST